MATITRRLVDPALLLDPTRCPACGSPLAGPRCAFCGVDLSGDDAREVWELSRRAARALDDRDRAIDHLVRNAHRASAPSPVSPVLTAPPVAVPSAAVPSAAVPSAAVPSAAVPPVAVPPPPAVTPAPSSPHRPHRGVPGVQGLLVGLGALLLSVAALVFLVASWDVLSLGWRAAVIATLTAGVLVAAARLRPGLPSTGEALGALGAVLVLADAWAVRRTGLGGADEVGGVRYWAVAAAVCAGLLLACALWGAVRAWSLTAVVLGPLAVALGGVDVALRTDEARDLAWGLLAAAVLACSRRATPSSWRAERVLLGVWAVGAVLAASVIGLGYLMVDDGAQSTTVVWLVTSAVLGLQGVSDARHAHLCSAWWAASGLTLAGSAAAAAWLVVLRAGWPAVWLAAALPVAVGLVLMLLAAVAAPRRRVAGTPARSALLGAYAGWFAALSPAVLLVAAWLVVPLLVAVPRWRGAWGTSLTSVIEAGRVGSDLAPTMPDWTATVVAAAVALVVALSAGRLAVLPGLRATVPPAAAVLAFVAPLAPRLTVTSAVALCALVGVAAAAVAVVCAGSPGRGAGRRFAGPATVGTAFAVAAITGTTSVVLAWAVEPLSVPVTLLGALALLAARRPLRAPDRRVGAVLVATVAVFVAAGGAGAVRDLTVVDRFAVAGLVGAALAAAATAGVRLPRGVARRSRGLLSWTAPDRLAVVVPATAALGAALVAAIVEPGRRPDRVLELLLAAATTLSLVVVLRARRVLDVAGSGAVLAALGAFTLPASLASLAVALREELAADARSALPSAVVVAVVVVLGAVLLVTLDLLDRPVGVPQRLGGEAGLAATAVAALALAVGQDHLWVVLLLLGAAAAAIATQPDRRPVGWLAGVLLTGSTWSRLLLSDVGVVEAYTLPPAAALLTLATLRLVRRGPQPGAWRVLIPGLALAVVPSVLACASGSAVRPAVVIGLSALAVCVLWAVRERLSERFDTLGGVLAGTAGLAAAGAALVRVAAPVLTPAASQAYRLPVQELEIWTVPAALVLLVAGVLVLAGRVWRPPVPRDAAGAPALALAGVPTLTAVLVATAETGTMAWAGLRAGLVLVLGALPAVVAGSRRLPPLAAVTAWAGTALAVAAALTGLAAAASPVLAGSRVVEVWTVPVGAVLLALGAFAMARRPALRSWPALGPGLAVVLLPTALLAWNRDVTWRVLYLVVLAAAVVVAGAVRRLQAPLALGALVLAVHALDLAWPSLVGAYEALPRWVVLGVTGAVLLGLGATYERRLRQLNAVRLRFAALR